MNASAEFLQQSLNPVGNSSFFAGHREQRKWVQVFNMSCSYWHFRQEFSCRRVETAAFLRWRLFQRPFDKVCWYHCSLADPWLRNMGQLVAESCYDGENTVTIDDKRASPRAMASSQTDATCLCRCTFSSRCLTCFSAAELQWRQVSLRGERTARAPPQHDQKPGGE